MSAKSVLKLLQWLLDDHERAGGTGLTVIPVVDDELGQDHEVLEQGLRRAGGVYIRARAVADARVLGTYNRQLAEVVTETFAQSSIGFDIGVVDETTHVAVRRTDRSLPVNDREKLMLAIAAALFSAELSEHSLAAIAWPESGLARPSQDAVWELLTNQVSRRGLGTLRTLVPIAGGSLVPTLHCESVNSARYVLSGPKTVRRKSAADLRARLTELVRGQPRPTVVFLGAGASASAGMPLGDEMRDWALDQFFGPGRYSSDELGVLFHQWLVDNERLLDGEEDLRPDDFAISLTLERVLREEFHRVGRESSLTLARLQRHNELAGGQPTRARRALAGLLRKAHRIVLVTTNFDTLIEEEMGDAIEVFAEDSNFAASSRKVRQYLATGGQIPYLKLHGTITDSGSIVADVDSTALGLHTGAAAAIRELLGQDSAPTPWVYIGYSMRDPDVTELLAGPEFADGLDEQWVAPIPDDSVERFARVHREARWDSRPSIRERTVTETADRFLVGLDGDWRVS